MHWLDAKLHEHQLHRRTQLQNSEQNEGLPWNKHAIFWFRLWTIQKSHMTWKLQAIGVTQPLTYSVTRLNLALV